MKKSELTAFNSFVTGFDVVGYDSTIVISILFCFLILNLNLELFISDGVLGFWGFGIPFGTILGLKRIQN